jgi:hypothetical protein
MGKTLVYSPHEKFGPGALAGHVVARMTGSWKNNPFVLMVMHAYQVRLDQAGHVVSLPLSCNFAGHICDNDTCMHAEAPEWPHRECSCEQLYSIVVIEGNPHQRKRCQHCKEDLVRKGPAKLAVRCLIPVLVKARLIAW